MGIADSQLLEAYVRDRDAEAFRQLVGRHIDFVYTAAVRQSTDRHVAEDIAQAVFVLLAQRAGTLRGQPTIKGWLFNATRYVAANSRRAQSRRKLHEREAAAMRCEVIEQHQEPDISPHLDDALARLPERDRQVLLLRFFEDLPLAQVSDALGISEHAAKKRLTRAIERVRQLLQRHGVAVASVPLAALLSASATQAAPAHLAQTAANLALGGAAAGIGSNSVFSIAQGAGKMMFRKQMTLIVAKCVLVTLCAGAAAAVVAQRDGAGAVQPSAATAALGPTPKMLADNPSDTQPADWEFEACRQVMRSIVDAYENDDQAALKKIMYFGPGTNPQVVKAADVMIKCDLATYRVQKAAIAKFGSRATGLNLNMSTAVVLMVDLLARLRPEDAVVDGDVMVIKPSDSLDKGVWRWPIYFRHVDGGWKLDCGKTFRFKIRVVRRKPVDGETEEQTWTAGSTQFADGLNAVAVDLENGKIRDIVETQQRFYKFHHELETEFTTLSMNTQPAH